MRKIFILCMLACPARVFAGLSISEAAPGTAGADWVEISFFSECRESADISKLYVTMYYGTNEPLAASPVTLYSYDRPETMWDDRFAVVHLTDAVTPDETDATGDTDRNGRLDLYCNNYQSSLWNGECCAALDTNDEPADGMLDFVAWSDCEGEPSATIGKYVESASSRGQWSDGSYDRSASVQVPKGGVNASQSIVRIAAVDTNTKNDFAVTDFQTPGAPNICGHSSQRELFTLERRKIPVVPGNPSRRAVCSFYVNTQCDVRLKVYTDTGYPVFESDRIEDAAPGMNSVEWPCRGARTGLYIGVLEGSESRSRRLLRERFYFIVAAPK